MSTLAAGTDQVFALTYPVYPNALLPYIPYPTAC